MSHDSAAKAARLRKEKHPELYCIDKRCLWKLSSGPCPKHTKEACHERPRMFTSFG